MEQGTKKFEAKHTNEGQEDLDLGHSFFEGEWFKQYVQVTVGPLSGQRLSKSIQSVKVLPVLCKSIRQILKIFKKDVKWMVELFADGT